MIQKIQPFFLSLNDTDCEINKYILVIQYSLGIKLFFAHGEIKSLLGIEYLHTASIEHGSSRSPIINNHLQVVGIHKSRRPTELQM